MGATTTMTPVVAGPKEIQGLKQQRKRRETNWSCRRSRKPQRKRIYRAERIGVKGDIGSKGQNFLVPQV